MGSSKPDIAGLQENVEAAREEFDLAVAFRAVWAPTAYDTDLHRRMGVSFATHGLQMIRTACQRELVLALCRLWDRDKRAVGMEAIGRALRDNAVIDALAVDRANRMSRHPKSPLFSLPDDAIRDAIRDTIQEQANEALAIIDRYDTGGAKHHILEGLRHLRNKRLAHREVAALAGPPAKATKPTPQDKDVEAFYEDMSALIKTLLSTVVGHAYDPADTAGIFRTYAGHFWAGVKGERTEGHPHYRAPTSARKGAG